MAVYIQNIYNVGKSCGSNIVNEQILTNDFNGKNFDFYVAEENNIVVGIALFFVKYSTWKGKCLFLEDIIVTEIERGNGIGKLLFNKIIEVAKETKVRRMEWQVLDWNKTAIDFYKKYDSTLDGEWINCKLTNHDLEKF